MRVRHRLHRLRPTTGECRTLAGTAVAPSAASQSAALAAAVRRRAHDCTLQRAQELRPLLRLKHQSDLRRSVSRHVRPVLQPAATTQAALAAQSSVATTAASARAGVAVQRRAHAYTLHCAQKFGPLFFKSYQRDLCSKVPSHLRPVHHRAAADFTTGTTVAATAVPAARVATLSLRRRAHAGALRPLEVVRALLRLGHQ